MKPDVAVMGHFPPATIETLDRTFTVHATRDCLPVDPAEAGKVRGIAAGQGAKVDPKVIAAYPNLEVVSSFGAGYDKIDVAEALERRVIVSNTPHALTEEVADLTLALVLATCLDLVRADGAARSGGGDPGRPRKLSGAKVGIFGLGRIGRAIAKRLEAFGCEVHYHNRSRTKDPFTYHATLKELAAAVSILIVAVPGGAETEKKVGQEVLEALGPDGILVNIGRGSVVDEAALTVALQRGTIDRAGLDVFENEPKVPAELTACQNAVLLPHVGSATVVTRNAMGQAVVDNLTSWFGTGRVQTPVPECEPLVAQR
jgi:lactate dehydrogenase-like 2-hydroxyacid dehydrogenase